MTPLEIANLLNTTEADAEDLLDTWNEFDRKMNALYDLEPDDDLDALIECAEWDFYCDCPRNEW